MLRALRARVALGGVDGARRAFGRIVARPFRKVCSEAAECAWRRFRAAECDVRHARAISWRARGVRVRIALRGVEAAPEQHARST
eukprot:4792375-Lingulodinium_polyedra.AAC.1